LQVAYPGGVASRYGVSGDERGVHGDDTRSALESRAGLTVDCPGRLAPTTGPDG
jgi:hypothetical protein